MLLFYKLIYLKNIDILNNLKNKLLDIDKFFIFSVRKVGQVGALCYTLTSWMHQVPTRLNFCIWIDADVENWNIFITTSVDNRHTIHSFATLRILNY